MRLNRLWLHFCLVVVELVSCYFNQTLTWEHITSSNEYNETLTSDITNIKGRKETGFKLIRNSQGQEVVSSATVFTESAIINNDLIDGKLVISVESMIELNGSIMFYEVFLI